LIGRRDRVWDIRGVTGGVASQGISSLANFLLVVAVARAESAASFGAFAIGYSLLLVAQAGARGILGETISVTTLPASEPARVTPSRPLGGAVVIGVLAACVLGVFAFVLPAGDLSGYLKVAALGLPFVILQDAARFVAFGQERPSVAAFGDLGWLLFQILGWATAAGLGHFTGRVIFAVWCLAAAGGYLTIIGLVGRPDLPNAGYRWLRETRSLGLSFGLEQVMQSAASHGTIYVLGAVAGLPAAGALRAAQSLYGPLNSFYIGVSSVMLPKVVRLRHSGHVSGVWVITLRLSGSLACLALLAVVLVQAIPDSLGRRLLGDTWEGAHAVLVPIGLVLVAGGVIAGARLGLRALLASRESLMLRAVTGVLGLSLGTVGAFWSGAVGAAYGLAVAYAATAVLSLLLLRRVPGNVDSARDERRGQG
jgi:O-antigen/teichoic acid export membrane protein